MNLISQSVLCGLLFSCVQTLAPAASVRSQSSSPEQSVLARYAEPIDHLVSILKILIESTNYNYSLIEEDISKEDRDEIRGFFKTRISAPNRRHSHYEQLFLWNAVVSGTLFVKVHRFIVRVFEAEGLFADDEKEDNKIVDKEIDLFYRQLREKFKTAVRPSVHRYSGVQKVKHGIVLDRLNFNN